MSAPEETVLEEIETGSGARLRFSTVKCEGQPLSLRITRIAANGKRRAISMPASATVALARAALAVNAAAYPRGSKGGT